MKLDILGTEYDIDGTTDVEDSRLIDKDGYTDWNEKTIRYASEYLENAPSSMKNMDYHIRFTKRHEITHAALYESGMKEWADDEMLVDWISIQFPKLLKAFQAVDAI